jgi:hypothetical protein
MPQVLQALGPDDQKDLDKLLAYAKANPLSEAQIKATLAGDRPSVGDYLEHKWVWPIGFRCVFSFEHHPMGLCRHLSVSVYDKSDPEPQIPSPRAMNTIGDAFGFKEGKLDYMWIDQETKAINLVQKVED